MDFKRVVHNGEIFFSNNYPTFLTSLGVAGVIATSALTVQATIEAVRLIDEDELRSGTSDDIRERLRQRSRLVWKLYAPPVITGIATIGCIVTANRTSARRAAALATAYSITQKAYGDYRTKVAETLGASKETRIRDELSRDQMVRHPVSKEVVIHTGGETLCFDQFTGRYFKSDVESLRKAQNDINHQLIHEMYASLSDFYSLIGLPTTSYSDEVGWTSTQKLSLDLSTCMSEDQQPCVAIDFSVQPTPNYYKFN